MVVKGERNFYGSIVIFKAKRMKVIFKAVDYI